MKEIREMTMEEVSERLAEISEELKNDTADLAFQKSLIGICIGSNRLCIYVFAVVIYAHP